MNGFVKGTVVRKAGADAVALFYYVLHHNFGIGKCVEVVSKERFDAGLVPAAPEGCDCCTQGE
jgi:hypothetical protein